jgi:N-acetylmuramic acid 6-phosphate etherase
MWGHMDLADLVTEQRREDLSDLDLRGTLQLVELMAADQIGAVEAVKVAAPAIAAAVDAVVVQLRAGGRLVYVGAGTAGRLGLLDAAECPPTFNTDRVVGVLAGGDKAALTSHEAVEDDAERGAADLARLAIDDRDAVVGIAASGRTPYTIGAVDHAGQCGAVTVGIACNPGSQLSRHVDHPIEIVVGSEVIAGSTRLKAGTVQKIVLNTISTLAMVRIGKTFGNLMVDVRATNEKLRDRARRIVGEATDAEETAVDAAIAAAGGDAKVAIVMLLTGADADAAAQRLAVHNGVVRAALEMRP